jgi:hypothetical protein
MNTNFDGWIFLSGDVDWEDYGGTWAKKVNNNWYILAFANIG